MSNIALRTLQDAPEAARPLLQNALDQSGYIPNLLAVLANAPTTLEAYITLSGINGRGSLSFIEREVVQLIAATTHGCAFCVAGHTAIARHKAGIPSEIVEVLRARGELLDDRLETLAAFTREVIASRGKVDERTFAAFLSAGFTEAQALEVILGVSLATLCNFANSFARTPLNPELEVHRWEERGE